MLSHFLKEKLEDKNWAVYHLHRVSGISTNAINMIRDGKTKTPKVVILKKLAKAFGDEPEVLLEKAGYPEK